MTKQPQKTKNTVMSLCTFLSRLDRLNVRVDKVLKLRLENRRSLSGLLLQSPGRALTHRQVRVRQVTDRHNGES